jgi:HEAT repeat protein
MTETIHQLLNTIENGKPEEIWEAAKRLESITNDTVLSLLRLLESGRQAETRSAAAYVLGFGRYASARGSLEHVLAKVGEESSVRGHAAEALAYIGDARSAEVLLRHLDGEDLLIKYWCIFALGQVGDDQAVDPLKHAAESAGEKMYRTLSVRAEALDAVAQIERRVRGSDKK